MNGPRHVFFNLSTGCNYKCAFCVNESLPAHTFMDVGKLLELEELVDGADIIDVTGYGEIILHPRFKDVVDALTWKKKKFSFSTNGSLLTKDVVDRLAQSSLYLVNISINSLDRDTYAMITKTGDIEILLGNLEYLFSIPRKYEITLSAVITSYAIKELDWFVHYAAANKANRLRFLPMTPAITTYPEEMILRDTPENRKALKNAEDLAARFGVPLQSFSFDHAAPAVTTNKNACMAPFDQMCVGQGGEVTPCCWLPFKIMGNLRDTPWREIWESSAYQELRASVARGGSEHCRNCREFG